jgi:hypothetical protein
MGSNPRGKPVSKLFNCDGKAGGGEANEKSKSETRTH